MKRILGIILAACMLLSILPINVFATSNVTIFNVTITEPKAGEKPVNSASVPQTASTEIVKVTWDGDFDANGCFIEGNEYKVTIIVRIKADQDKVIKYVKSTTKVNGHLAAMRNISEDKKQAQILYTFKAAASETPQTTDASQSAQTTASLVAKDASSAKYDELSLHKYEWEVLRLCNIERAKQGLDSLSLNGTLQNICDIREKEIKTLFSHDRPDGSDCYSAIPSTYRANYFGENIAKGQRTPEEVVESWMNSPGHRANILKPSYDYMGIGYNPDGNHWVQFFSSSDSISKVTRTPDKEEFTEKALRDVVITIKASNGYMSYMPVDFDSMTLSGNKYYPRLDASNLMSFVKVEPTQEELENDRAEPTTSTTPTEDKVNDIDEGSLFGRFVPITHAYSTNFFVDYNMTTGSTKRFGIGTRFNNETTEVSPIFAEEVKRSDYQGHYIKFNYLGTYGTVGKDIAVNQLGIINEEEYNKVMRGEESEWASAYNLTKDTIVISTEIYDANKKFVRKLSPACVIVATDASGNFITFSKYLGVSATNLFAQTDNFFAPDKDEKMKTKTFAFEIEKLMLTSKAEAEKLLPPANITKYEYNTYPELEGKKQYNTNHILDDDEFVTPSNVYYQVGVDFKQIDPVVKHKIENVVSYSYYNHGIDTKVTQRNIVTSDGTLYGVTSEYEKKVIATNVKKATANHYLTNNGEVKELGGKILATDVYDYDESNDGWIIGILKNDCSFYMGYTYIEGKDGYARGLSKMMDGVKAVVPNGLITKDNTFYRWNNDIEMTDYDEEAFVNGEFISNWEINLGLVLVCHNAARVFPYECLTKVWALSGDLNKDQSVYGFVQNSSGKLYGYSTTFHNGFNTYSEKVERIFPVYSSPADGNFVGIKLENNPYIDVIACRICDSNIYRYGPLVGGAAYVCETQGGYYGENGKVYGLEARPARVITEDGLITFICTENEITNNPNMYRRTATYRAYSRDTDSNIPLLPNVYTWMYDEHRITLLERTDGSVWMAAILNPSTYADLIAQLGGYESSNVFQVSTATTKKVDVEFINISDMQAPTTSKPKFADVAQSAWYATPVNWAVEKEITSGTSATTFSPDNTCTRAQILTFMWRAAGSPKMNGANPFADVTNADYFYDAALWAYENGMVTGSTFEGDTPCTRSATVVYLWKNAGAPYTSYYGTFSDVTSGSGYASAVAWAVNNGVTSGTSETTFSPDDTCTRAQIVTFLYRAFK